MQPCGWDDEQGYCVLVGCQRSTRCAWRVCHHLPPPAEPLSKPMEDENDVLPKIARVAVRMGMGDQTLTLSAERPHRHHDLLRQVDSYGLDPNEAVQGFMTDDDRFVERAEAAQIALASGQVAALKTPPDLYSEDLW